MRISQIPVFVCVVAGLCLSPISAQTIPQARARLVVELSDRSRVMDAAISPDGKMVVISADNLQIWNVAEGSLVRKISGLKIDHPAVFGTDGNSLWVHSATDDVLMDIRSGLPIRRLTIRDGNSNSYAMSSDGRFIAVGYKDGTVSWWNVETSMRIGQFRHQGGSVALAFSADGRFLVAGYDRIAVVWDLDRKIEVQHIDSDPPWGFVSVALSRDNTKLVATLGNSTRSWDLSTGKRLHVFYFKDNWQENDCSSFTLSPDGSQIAFGGTKASIWDLNSGARQIVFDFPATALAYSSDGLQLLAAAQGSSTLWDLKSSRQIQSFSGKGVAVQSATFSPNGSLILSGAQDGTIRLWETNTGKQARTIDPHMKRFPSPEFTSSGASFFDISVNSADLDGLWDTDSGQLIVATDCTVGSGTWTSMHEDGILTSTAGGILYNRWTGKRLIALENHPDVANIELSQDESTTFVVTQTDDGCPVGEIYDMKTGKQLHRYRDGCWFFATPIGARSQKQHGFFFASDYWNMLPGDSVFRQKWALLDTVNHRALIRAESVANSYPVVPDTYALSSDGSMFVMASGGMGYLWDVKTGSQLKELGPHFGSVKSGAFSPDNRFLVATGDDGNIHLWDVATAKDLLTLIILKQGWAAVDSLGRFDTSELDGATQLHWIVEDDPLHALPLEIFMRDYYSPGLLARVMNGEALPEIGSIAQIKNRVQPDVSLVSVTPSTKTIGSVDVVVHATSHTDERKLASGLQDLRLFRDGQMVSNGYIEGPLKDGDYTFRDVKLKSDSTKVTFTAYAFNSERVKSATATLDYEPQTTVVSVVKPKAYMLQVGVNHYAASLCELNYSVNDAEKLSAALAAKLTRRYEPVPIKLESTLGGNTGAATKQAIHDQLSQIAAAATPDDVFFMSFSGHGYSSTASKGNEFYILPSDVEGSCRGVDDALLKMAISADELADWLRPIDASDMTLILDTCYSAESVQAGDFKPGPMGSRGLGQLAYDKRMRVLAASQSDEVAHEYDYLQQGLLTYVLTHEALDEGKADWKPVDNRITLSEWLGYAAYEVPKFVPDATKSVVAKSAGDRFSTGSTRTTFQVPAFFDFSKTDALELQ
jgi:WD40 repeat protein